MRQNVEIVIPVCDLVKMIAPALKTAGLQADSVNFVHLDDWGYIGQNIHTTYANTKTAGIVIKASKQVDAADTALAKVVDEGLRNIALNL